MLSKVLVIVGPTASGKSALGVELAKKFNGEVISADSRQVYRGLDIGTGKITKREMKGVPHHLLDVASPSNSFSASAYAKKARIAILGIQKRGRLPIIVGGTGFYIDALLGRIELAEVPPNRALRSLLSKKTTAQLFAHLRRLDPKRAKNMDTPSERNNKVRLIRAIEVAKARGKTVAKPGLSCEPLWIGIRPSDKQLRKKISIRLFERMRLGMVSEARRLHRSRLSYRRMRELGLEYRSLARHLEGTISVDKMEKELQSQIWRYARKQIGYWKRNKDITWFTPTQQKRIEKVIKKWLAE